MDQHISSHGGHGGEHGAPIPAPSIWPFVLGIAALAVGLGLVWLSKDTNNDVAGPLLGAAILLALIAGVGWAYEDTRSSRKAKEGAAAKPREVRFTQVVTFAITEGRIIASRLQGGILDALDRTDNALRDLPGFQDLRIIASPAAVGPSQVLVETTWASREGLALYDETRRTLLDIIAAHPDDVVAGSVQVFDMEVVRDTKPVGFGLASGPALALLGSLLVFGFIFGAGLNLFEGDSGGGGTPANGGTTPAASNLITATDNKFDKATLEAPPNTKVSFELKNAGKVKHNIHFLDKAGGNTLADGAEGKIIDGGTSETLTFTTPAAGNYYFQCDLHPDTMKGTFVVKEGAPVPGAAAAAPGDAATGGAAAGLTVVGTDNKYDKTKLESAAGDVAITFKNNGKVKHNLNVFDKKGGKSLAEGKIIDPGQTDTVKFTATAGSYYYQCDLHPDQMFGTLTVK